MNKKNNYLSQQKILIVLEVANNHQGDVEHAIELIKQYHHVIKNYSKNFNFAFKFQYRDLETFVHKDFKDSDIKYVRRFLDTELSSDEWNKIIKEVINKIIITGKIF